MAFITPLPPSHRPPPRPSIRCATTPPQSTAEDPIQTTITRLQTLSNTVFDTFFTPLLSCSVLSRSWQNLGGNYILHPSRPPKAVIHFLGGAFFAAAPHILYRTLLERLCARGYCIVASPYEIQFNHLELVADITERWERVESDLALRYGAVPVIGLGHSAGCVFHSIAGALFDDASPKAANVLVSFCNRKAKDSIPMYKELVKPTADVLVGVTESLPTDVRTSLADWPETVDAFVEGGILTPTKVRENVIPSLKESRRLVRQVWPLLKQVVEVGGVREFHPDPDDVCKAVERRYAVERNLIVKFGGDDLDDSDMLATALRGGGKDVAVVELQGSHLTPLGQDLPEVGGGWGVLQEGVNAWGLRRLTALELVIDEWIDKGIADDLF